MPPKPRPCDVIAFDLDGTLVDTARLHVDATQAAMQAVFGAVAPPELVARSLGHPLPESMRIVSAGREHIKELTTAFMLYYADHEHEEAQCFPATFTVLEAVRQRGVGLALLSNKLRVWGLAEIARLGLAPYFAQVVFMEDMPTPKPSGLALRPITTAFGVAAARVLVIGDGVGDIACAHNAGALSGAALWGAHDPAPLLATQPTYTFPTMSEILDLLE